MTGDFRAFVERTRDELAHRRLPEAAIAHVLRHRLHSRHGFLLEFGVWSGTTINAIAADDFSRTVWGFDSFQGLPEAWRAGYPAGAFDTGGRMPRVHPNVVLVPGWFHETLPPFRERFLRRDPVSLLHIDCDLYSSTITVLRGLHENLVPGTILVFDELLNYPGCEEHELKALFEYCRDFGREIEYVGAPGPPGHWERTGVDDALVQQAVVRLV
jgi:hypothetical protein